MIPVKRGFPIMISMTFFFIGDYENVSHFFFFSIGGLFEIRQIGFYTYIKNMKRIRLSLYKI